MKAVTRLFGTIDIADDKVITMENGMIGFPDLKHFALIFDEEKEERKFKIMWFQSMDDGDIAFPVTDPVVLKEDYNPYVSETIIAQLGDVEEEDFYILVTVTVPKKVEDFSVNLKAPIIINMSTKKGAQIITEEDYPVKFKVYDLLKVNNEKVGE